MAMMSLPACVQARATIWDLTLGLPADQLPGGFAEFACGTNGGPPGRPIAGFAEFAECPADDSGLHEVYFRYDDEAEYVARALEQSRAIEFYAGTRVMGVPVVASALFNDAGDLAGLRLATDPRGVDPGDRNDHWMLAGMLMQRYGSVGWSCVALPAAAGETPVSTYFVKDRCAKSAGNVRLMAEREYFHRRGQYFVDELGKAQPGKFTSASTFEVTVIP